VTHAADPFRVLGLQPRPDLTDDEVHTAWRRIASATHPDRFAAAAAAYTVLRTRFGRGEVLADLTAQPQGTSRGGRRLVMDRGHGQRSAAVTRALARVRRGRPARLALRIAAAVALAAAAVAAAGPHPAAPALVTGVATWLVLTARHDLAPREDSGEARPPKTR